MTTADAIASVGDRLLRALPPAMVALLILNILFLGVASYVFSHNVDARNAMLRTIIDKCLEAR